MKTIEQMRTEAFIRMEHRRLTVLVQIQESKYEPKGTERDGYETGIANKPDPNPYIPGKYYDHWQKGYDAGCKERLSWDDK